MRIYFIGSILVTLALLAISPGMHAQTSAKPGPGAATAIRTCLEVGKRTAQYPSRLRPHSVGYGSFATDYSE